MFSDALILIVCFCVLGVLVSHRGAYLRTLEVSEHHVTIPTRPCNEETILRFIESKRDFDQFVSGVTVVAPESNGLQCARSGPRNFEGTFTFYNRRPSKIRPVVYDTFLVSTEMHLMLLRMETLQDVVDFFVFVDSNMTYTGKVKPLHYLENMQKFHKFRHRILYRAIQFPENVTGLWEREWYSRDQVVALALEHAKSGDDLILHSDVDEIPNPFVVRLLRECEIIHKKTYRSWDQEGEGVIMHQVRSHGDLGCYSRNYNPWYGTRVETKRNVRGGKQMRADRGGRYALKALDGGWHLSFVPLGDYSMLRTKFATFAHTNDQSQQTYKKRSDGEWARQVVDGFPGGDYVCDRTRGNVTAPPAAFAYVNEFGPFMTTEQRALANFIYQAVCVHKF